MIDAGLPLVQCLDILSSQQENKTFKDVLVKVKEDVESGSTFADALRKHPKAFNELYVNLVAAGEVGGILDTILNRLAAYIEKALKLKKQVKSANDLSNNHRWNRSGRHRCYFGFCYSSF